MAGDWIKMRGNLWDDPRVAGIADVTDAGEAAVVGGLYWLWASADQHSESGAMPGLTLRTIDRKTGIKGFGAALVSIGWIVEQSDGVQIVRFEEHNGKSAKRRCSEAIRKMSARDADKAKTCGGQQAEIVQQSCAPRERERDREEVNLTPKESASTTQPAVSASDRVCARLRKAGIKGVNPSNPKLLALLTAGIPECEFGDLADEQGARGKSLAWILAAIEGRRRDAAAAGAVPAVVKEWHETASGIEAKAVELGIPRETENGIDAFPVFKDRVFAAAGIHAEAA